MESFAAERLEDAVHALEWQLNVQLSKLFVRTFFCLKCCLLSYASRLGLRPLDDAIADMRFL